MITSLLGNIAQSSAKLEQNCKIFCNQHILGHVSNFQNQSLALLPKNTYLGTLIKNPMLNQKLWNIAFRITILTNKSSLICLMLFQIQMYKKFINCIESIKIRLYHNMKRFKKNSSLRRARGTSSFPSNTLRFCNPQTMVPYKPVYNHEEYCFKT